MFAILISCYSRKVALQVVSWRTPLKQCHQGSVKTCIGHGVGQNGTDFVSFSCALSTSIWGHCSQVIVLTSIWLAQEEVWQWHSSCCFFPTSGYAWTGASKILNNQWFPKRPKIEKMQERPPGLEFSNEIEIFKRAPTKPLFLVGHSEGQDWNFQARLNFSSEIENSKRDFIFSIFGPLGFAKGQKLQCELQYASNLHCSAFGAPESWRNGNTFSTPPICIVV